MFIGVYILLPGYRRGCKVGAVRTMFNDVACVTNRIGVINYVATKQVKTSDFFTKVGGYAHLNFVDQGRDFTAYDRAMDHASMKDLVPPRLDDQLSIKHRLRTPEGAKSISNVSSAKKKGAASRSGTTPKAGKASNNRNSKRAKLKNEYQRGKRKRSEAAEKQEAVEDLTGRNENSDDSSSSDEWAGAEDTNGT